ncbi:MAG: hypothetical protein FWF94_01445 [Oscillospiraceae bacterium]|nr:hypothetical protein [Oscillospiraceae bacterium]
MKRNSKLYILTAVIATLAMVTGVFAFTGCSEKTGAASYERAERALITNAVSEYSTLEAAFQKLTDNNKTQQSLTLSITPKTFLADLLGANEINPTVFEINGSSDNDEGFSNIVYKNGDKEILAADVWLSKEQVIINLPKILDKYLFADMSMLEQLGDASIDSGVIMSSFMEGFSMGFKAGVNGEVPELPSKAAIDALINVVLDEYFAYIAEIEPENDVELEINGTVITTSKMEIEITDEIAYKVVIAVLNEVKNNQEIRTFIDEIVKMAMPEASGMLDMMLAGAISESESALEAIDAPEASAVMTVYINGSDIVKRVITPYDEQGSNEKIEITTYKNKDDFFTEVICNLDGNNYNINATGNKKSGEFELKINGIEGYNIGVNGTLKDGKKGSFNGEIFVNGIAFADVEASWSDKADSKAAPALDSTNAVDLSNEEQLATIGMELLGAISTLTEDLDNNGVYDIIGLLLQQNLLQGLGGGMDAFNGMQDWDMDDFDFGDFDLDDFDLGDFVF